ncbi:hypothetical protein LTR47_010224 [Exophiala xenobiotica]|nr:hypothetical protein LTR41_001478 [Exophiala xenobiotica]KAK5223377.1 hypothetical protein LTR47_010224 [Exophiala xenobiotica]KAK5244271.1 hypothetical protein LTS06_010110 [Exophiala xenobiotica]KAK5327806.1 hypothetical protein LTR93_003192 [Exophiala xenobiotica]KAK5348034.1 hypothetical protein LTR61_008286 [Exophiala xenobiotica]
MGTHFHASPANGHTPQLQYVDLAFDSNEIEQSAFTLAYRIQPKWREGPGDMEIVRFTEGITNTLLKLAKHVPGHSQSQIDQDSILLRAYGNNTDILIDRDREAKTHALCAERGLAPPLLARFKNGLLYRYIPGQVCTPQDLIQEPIWRAVARKLGKWHAQLPVSELEDSRNAVNGRKENGITSELRQPNGDAASRLPQPNIWSVIQKWIHALPNDSPKQKARRELLQQELDRSIKDLHTEQGPGMHGLVLGHCDLLSANVIMLPKGSSSAANDELEVSIIDYEYAVPCPAAFDVANHFAEWGGYDCDYNMLPTKSIRRQFLQEYLESYKAHSDNTVSNDMLDVLTAEVDRYRGMPGFYWGVWALIQATISQINFDYASYAEVRLGEYFGWRAEESGSRATEKAEMPLRERRWAEP